VDFLEMTLKECSFLPNPPQFGVAIATCIPVIFFFGENFSNGFPGLARMEGIALCPPFQEGLQAQSVQVEGRGYPPEISMLSNGKTSVFLGGGKGMVDTMQK